MTIYQEQQTLYCTVSGSELCPCEGPPLLIRGSGSETAAGPVVAGAVGPVSYSAVGTAESEAMRPTESDFKLGP